MSDRARLLGIALTLTPLACSLDAEGVASSSVASGGGGAPVGSSSSTAGPGGGGAGGGGPSSSAESTSASSTAASSSVAASSSPASSSTGGPVPCDQQSTCYDCVTCEGTTDCIAEGNACSANPNCAAFGTCAFGCCDPMCDQACVMACGNKHPGGQPDWKSLRCCAAPHCPTACPANIGQGC